MNFILSLALILVTPLVFSEVSSSADNETPFECRPSARIKNRVNEHCIQAMDISEDIKKPYELDLKKNNKVVGKAFVLSKTLEDGRVLLELAHQCKGQRKSSWKALIFCGYPNSKLDRQSPGTAEIRQEIARTHKLSEKTDSKKIDEWMAREINPWLADPRDNIEVSETTLKIKTLQESEGMTCYSSKELTYSTDCP